MHLQAPESGGPDEARPSGSRASSTLPFGQPAPLASISAPAYVTAQLLVQQVAFKLSDKIFSYSPDTFDLDLAARQWAADESRNVHGYTPSVLPLQTRTGAGTLALGYIFSPDFDVAKRHVPQTLIAPSASLQQLRPALDQLSLLYSLSSPFVAHLAAADYTVQHGLVSNYETALRLADDLGLALVASSSTYEAQHMSIFSTLLATLTPTLHIYDGIRVARETLRIVDVLGESAVDDLYTRLAAEIPKLNARLDTAGKLLELLRLFNDDLGTVYEPFEYHGHETPDHVLVAFGSVETQIAKQTLTKLAGGGAKVGVVNVRVYRPFIEEAFLEAVPASARTLAVLGQVRDEAAVKDQAIASALYGDVLTAVKFAGTFDEEPDVVDIKYSPAQTLTPQGLVDTLHEVLGARGVADEMASLIVAQQYTFWDVDDSAALHSPAAIARVLAKESTTNVYAHAAFDNLTLGGVVRTDLRASKTALEAPYAVSEADVAVVGDERLLKEVDVLKSVAEGGKLLLKLSNLQEDQVEKRLPPAFRRRAYEKGIGVFILDTSRSPAFEKDASSAKLLLELGFLKLAQPQPCAQDLLGMLAPVEGHAPTLQQSADALDQCLCKLEVPAGWGEAAPGQGEPEPAATIRTNSFVPFEKHEAEEQPQLRDWQAVAKGLMFKEAYETRARLRPDLPVKTATIRVKENRRLTPVDYDRNIFHIEFDLGDSGLTYKIGEALGIHADNDEAQVDDFVRRYGLDPDEVVLVPAREEAGTLEARTVHQALTRNVDLLGKPGRAFYEALAGLATDKAERSRLARLGSAAGAAELKRRSDEETATYVDVLDEFPSARPGLHELVRLVGPLKRREYSIASAQAVTPTTVALMVVVVDWVDGRGRTRYGQATRYLSRLQPGAAVTASVKASVMKLPERDTAPLIMAGLGTGLAPFRAFAQHRALQRARGKPIGPMLLYLGARHRREEYLYGEEWEAYLAAGVVTLVGSAFSRDQPHKIYIQDRMRQTLGAIVEAYVEQEGSFYLCGPTWPVPDVTAVLLEAIAAGAGGAHVDAAKELERLKDAGRYVLEVY